MNKTLLPAVLLASAASAHAWNLEFQLGTNNPTDSGWETSTLTGLSVSFNATPELSLGATVSGAKFDLVGLGVTEVDTLSATFDLRYDLSTGGIRPFVGFSLGNTWVDTNIGAASALNSSVNVGMSFEVSTSVDIVLGARFYRLWDLEVKNVDLQDVEGIEGYLGVRFRI